jgi:hypothetical protein
MYSKKKRGHLVPDALSSSLFLSAYIIKQLEEAERAFLLK